MAGALVRQKMAYAFSVLDTDSSGSLEVGDFERLGANYARETGQAPDSESIAGLRTFLMSWWEALRAGADTNADGTVTLEEFTALFTGMADGTDRMTAAGEAVFDVLDTDASGTIGPDEYGQFLRVYGLDDSRAAEAFATFDTDGNGSLSRDEFAVLIADFFVGEDPSAPGNELFGPV